MGVKIVEEALRKIQIVLCLRTAALARYQAVVARHHRAHHHGKTRQAHSNYCILPLPQFSTNVIELLLQNTRHTTIVHHHESGLVSLALCLIHLKQRTGPTSTNICRMMRAQQQHSTLRG